jgi:DNA polymerase-4
VTLKVKYADFQQITRSRSFPVNVQSRTMLEQASLELLSALFPMRNGVRLLGITLSTLTIEQELKHPQLALAL